MYIKFKKFNEDTQLGKGHMADAGVDVFVGKDLVFKPHEVVVVPLGFGVKVPHNFVGQVYPRTSIARMGLNIAACPIDPDYSGEVHAIVTNMTNETVTVPAHKALCQLLIVRFEDPTFIPVEDWEDFRGQVRSDKGFGSTDKAV